MESLENIRELDIMNEIVPQNSRTKKGGIWVGNLLAAQDIQNLKINNITYVITALQKLRIGNTIKNLEDNGITVLHVNSMDIEEENISQHFDNAYKFIEAATKKGNILIHCLAGISRGSTICLAYLMKKRKKGWQELLEYIRKKRPYCEPNEGFKVQLTKYEKRLGIIVNTEPSYEFITDTGSNKNIEKTQK